MEDRVWRTEKDNKEWEMENKECGMGIGNEEWGIWNGKGRYGKGIKNGG